MRLAIRQLWPFVLAAACGAMAACTTARIAAAQSFPGRPITLIVPFSAGGTTDVTARIVAEHMSRTLGQQVVVENIGGAGGTIGTARAMRAVPDGYTIIMGQMGTHAAAVALYPNLPYKPDVDFEPIGLASSIPAIIVARKDFPANDLRTFAAYVKANADKLNVAHSGVGSVFFTTGLLLNSILGVRPTMVPFNGGAPAVSALVGGQVDYMSADVPAAVAQVQAGAIKAFAVGTKTRNPVLPDVPTAGEAGLPEYQASAWNGLFAPRSTPAPVLEKLENALDKALDDPGTRKRLLDLGSEIPDKANRGPRPLAALVKSEIARWTPILRAANVTGN
ncbi:MAG: tripartite tricarboxylate transporter substrate binding protein BugD [Xanthobacteraceae bacterium]|nr:tripartite tricarboxylate transporter substrate binding protein BugD [Xanthobacteraceae bacterium]